MAKVLASLAALAILAVPAAASASALSDLQAKLQSLLSQVSAVQAQISTLQESQAAAPAPATSGALLPYCLSLTHTLSNGSTDQTTAGEVTKLQQLLAEMPSLYPEGLITGYFGPATARAVARLQQAAGIVPSATAAGAGTVGLATRLALSQSCATSSSASPAASSPVQTGFAFISIDQPSLLSLSATPTLTGEAQNVATVAISVDAGTFISYENDSVSVVGGAWSATTSTLANGAYKVTVRSPKGNALAAGYLIVSASAAAPGAAATSSPSDSVSDSPYLNSGSGSPPPPPPSSPPTVSMSVNGSAHGATVGSGGKALIAWSSGSASACAISSDNPSVLSGVVPTASAGSSTGALTQTTMFTIVCTGTGGAPASSSVTVTVVPR